MDNFDKSEDVVSKAFECYLNQGRNSCWVGMKKCSQDLLISQISPRVLVFAGREAISEVENPAGRILPGL